MYDLALDLWRIGTLAAGVAMFLFAPNLTQSTLFFYSSGTVLGAVGAALVFLFIFWRFLPKVGLSNNQLLKCTKSINKNV
jgi:hypothetical protein